VRWTAFYSDCLHEVEPVTSGYRVTLTYNLYGIEALATAAEDIFTDLATLPDAVGADDMDVADDCAIAAVKADAADARYRRYQEKRRREYLPELRSGAAITEAAAEADGVALGSVVHASLAAAVATPLFLPLGGRLVWHCEHHYPIT
jgi:hypothetical protein